MNYFLEDQERDLIKLCVLLLEGRLHGSGHAHLSTCYFFCRDMLNRPCKRSLAICIWLCQRYQRTHRYTPLAVTWSTYVNLCANSWSGFCQHYQRWIYWRPKDFIFLLMNLQLFAMSFHMSLNSLEGPVSLSEREMGSFTPSLLDGRQLRSVMQEFFSFHLIMRHDEKYVYIFVSVIIIIIITNWGMSFSMIWNAQSSAPCYSSDHAKAESNNCFIIPSK